MFIPTTPSSQSIATCCALAINSWPLQSLGTTSELPCLLIYRVGTERDAGAALDLCRGVKELRMERVPCFFPLSYLGAGNVSTALAGGMASGEPHALCLLALLRSASYLWTFKPWSLKKYWSQIIAADD